MEILFIGMECFFIAVAQLLGIGLHVMQKIVNLGDKHPDKNSKEIWAIFKKEDWDTMAISGIVVVLHVFAHISVELFGPELRHGISYYMLWDIGLALVGGYAGQRLIYRVLGSAEKVLNKKADSLNQ